MKINFKALILSALCLLLVNIVNAQRGEKISDPAERAQLQTVEMTEKLALSTKQAEKIGEINLEYANKMKEARATNSEENPSAMRETLVTLRKEQNAEFKKVMTAAQFEEWEKIQAERRTEMKERRGSNPQKGKKAKSLENKG